METGMDKLNSPAGAAAAGKFFYRINKTNSFIFEKDCLPLGDPNLQGNPPPIMDLKPLDLPFECCFFEVASGFLASVPLDGFVEDDSMNKAFLIGFWILEESYSKYLIEAFYLFYNEEAHEYTVACDTYHCDLNDPDAINKKYSMIAYGWAQGILENLKTQEMGLESRRPYVKTKRMGSLQPLKIVRVAMKKNSSEVKPLFGDSIDWQHRWEVSGHWRKCKVIGKDRNGDYTVSGFTWVVPHVKGPESMPLIKKTRVIYNSPVENPRA